MIATVPGTVAVFLGGVTVGLLVAFLFCGAFKSTRGRCILWWSLLLMTTGIGCIAAGYKCGHVAHGLLISSENASVSIGVLEMIRDKELEEATFLLENFLYENITRHVDYLAHNRYSANLAPDRKRRRASIQRVLSYLGNYPDRLYPMTNVIPITVAHNLETQELANVQSLDSFYGIDDASLERSDP